MESFACMQLLPSLFSGFSIIRHLAEKPDDRP
jgi:hypothetical protein